MTARVSARATTRDPERLAARDADGRPELPEIRIKLLDGFEISVGGSLVTLPMAAQRFVSFLALHRRAVPRAHVAARLWFAGSESDAQACLRSALWRVRRDCGATVILATRAQLQLATEVAVDVQDQIAVARAALERHADLGERDLHVLDGELLPGWYDDWVLLERDRRRQLCLHALETIALRLADAGRYAEAVEIAYAALRRDELRESAHRVLMHVFLAEGNRADVIRGLRKYRELLRNRLDIELPPDLEALLADPAAMP